MNKLVAALLLAPATAFVAPATRHAPRSILSAEATETPEKSEAMDLDLEDMFEIFDEADKTVVVEGGAMSAALPWAPRPAGLDAFKLAGDRGFDPLGLGKTKADLIKYRNAEIKHARLAMLAAAGWPVSELWDGGLAKTLNLPADLVGDGMAPSLLNGGLGAISPFYWAFVLGAATMVELAGQSLKTEMPGDFGFDPLGLYPAAPAERLAMQESELRHGRTAMVAIVAFAAQELVSKEPVTKETPFFFEPIWTFLHDIGFGDLSRGFIEVN